MSVDSNSNYYGPGMVLVMLQGSLIAKLRCACMKKDFIPHENYPPVLILITPRTLQLAMVSDWPRRIKQEVYQHYVQNLVDVCMSLCPNTLLEKRRTSEDSVGLYIMANQLDFPDDKSHIHFVLSYMSGGSAELWANSFVEKALHLDNWGHWRDFTDVLSRDFSDGDEPRRALKAMDNLHQGKSTVANYFLKLEQLAATAGVDVQNSTHIILQVERNINPILIDQLYQLADTPRTYSDYKRHIIAMDEM
jgi:hypothetical protein